MGNFDIDARVRAPRRAASRLPGLKDFDPGGARSGNLWRSKVRAAGSCFRFNTLNVRTACLMHYEGASVRVLQKISVLWLRKKRFF